VQKGLAWSECRAFHWVQAELARPLSTATGKQLPSRLRAEVHYLLGDLAYVYSAHNIAREHGREQVDRATYAMQVPARERRLGYWLTANSDIDATYDDLSSVPLSLKWAAGGSPEEQ